jgi:hypothetical protein
MEGLREFFESKPGKALTAGLLAVAAVVGFFSVRSYFGGSAAAEMARERTFICSQSGKAFEHTLQLGEAIPVKSPFSGQNTGYPAELCYWTKDGRIKKEPTAVLLKTLVGERGPTFCPDCGRLVVGHNPKPKDGDAPPPTEGEFQARKSHRDGN